MPKIETWPRLSETLKHPKDPRTCQACGLRWFDATAIGYWQEHDELDAPEYRIVALCDRCADRIIENHPRLYRRLDRYEPMPGVMEICFDCTHRDGVRCACPLAQINGGQGLTVVFPHPSMVHVCRSPRSKSGWLKHYPGPPTACSGRSPDPASGG